MSERLKLMYMVVFDVFSLASLRKTAIRTLLAGSYFFALEYIEDNYIDINFRIPQYIFYLLGYILVTLFYYNAADARHDRHVGSETDRAERCASLVGRLR